MLICPQTADDVYKKLLASCKSDASVWISYATFLYAHDKVEEGRKLLGRALLSIEKKKRELHIVLFFFLLVSTFSLLSAAAAVCRHQ